MFHVARNLLRGDGWSFVVVRCVFAVVMFWLFAASCLMFACSRLLFGVC